MDGAVHPVVFGLSETALSLLMPMYVCISGSGHIGACGPTLEKLIPSNELIGKPFFDIFLVRRPSGLTKMADLRATTGQRLYLAFRGQANPGLRGAAAPMADGGGLILNLSFGAGIVDAVRRHLLTDADFAVTDLAMELLYVVEAKSAVMEELRHLNLRLQGAKSVAEEQALTDTLTGLRNRRALEGAMDHAVAAPTPFALMHIDLDFFKAVNDTLGHAAGDQVLREVARVLSEETRDGDIVTRVGGDEFVIILPGLSDPVLLKQIANRIIEKISLPVDFEGVPCRISGSIGMTISTCYSAPTLEAMLADADMALYAAKHAGRSQAMIHDPNYAKSAGHDFIPASSLS